MNYIELINRYWQEVEIEGWTPAETEIYFRLLDICNRSGWKNPFTLPNPRAVALMAVTENTLAAGRDRLVMKGLIGFRRGSRRKDAPTYCFPEKIEGEWKFPESFTAGFASNIEPKRGVKTEPKRGVKPTTYNKTKTKTNISPDGDSAVAPQLEESLFADEDKRAARRKTPKAKDPPPSPTFEEVLQYFLSQDADKRLANWEESARRFYDNFNAVDWRDKFNRRITRWDSRANSWILDDEKRQKEKEQHEQTRTDEPSPPSGGISIRGRVTPSCGLKRRNPDGED